MNILGISCYYHDAAAAIIVDGRLAAAAEEERFSRKKHDSGFPALAADFCLKTAGIKISDVDYVVFYEKPFRKFERIMMSYLSTYPKSLGLFREAMMTWGREKLWIRDIIATRLGVERDRVRFAEHHMSHAASAFLCSPFDEAAIMTVDGAGEWATQTLGLGRGGKIELFAEQRFPHSLGLLYSAFTAFLGFEVNEGEYKVMGMAPYGSAAHVDKVMKLLALASDGSFRLDMDYFSYHYHTEKTFTEKFERLFGAPRSPKARFVTELTSTYDDKAPASREEIARNQYYADVAASVQRVTEDVLVKTAAALYEKTKMKKLCIAGGVGLNCVANHRILAETPFEEIFVQPAAGDAGGALGAALYYYNCVRGLPRLAPLEHAYWGESYSDGEIKKFLEDESIKHRAVSDENAAADAAAEAVAGGKVVGWFQGRFEWGPRALGNRSILADPRRADMKDIVNIKIKFREPYRPFAPSAPSEEIGNYFETVKKCERPLGFMLMTLPVQKDKRDVIPAVTHVDGSARAQSVAKEKNPLYYRLIREFGRATGVPVVMNTSFNLRGEPIVNTPRNAYSTFMNSGMDALFMGRYIVEKEKS